MTFEKPRIARLMNGKIIEKALLLSRATLKKSFLLYGRMKILSRLIKSGTATGFSTSTAQSRVT